MKWNDHNKKIKHDNDIEFIEIGRLKYKLNEDMFTGYTNITIFDDLTILMHFFLCLSLRDSILIWKR